jgi:hypothetical protein
MWEAGGPGGDAAVARRRRERVCGGRALMCVGPLNLRICFTS